MVDILVKQSVNDGFSEALRAGPVTTICVRLQVTINKHAELPGYTTNLFTSYIFANLIRSHSSIRGATI